MKIRIKTTLEARKALYKANVPPPVIRDILGGVFDATSDFAIAVPWLGGEPVEWHIPPDALELVLNNETK